MLVDQYLDNILPGEEAQGGGGGGGGGGRRRRPRMVPLSVDGVRPTF